MTLAEAWRKNVQDEIAKPMKPVPGRIEFLKRLGYEVEQLHKMPLLEFDHLYRMEKKKYLYKLTTPPKAFNTWSGK